MKKLSIEKDIEKIKKKQKKRDTTLNKMKSRRNFTFSNPFQKDLKFSSGRSNDKSSLAQQVEKEKKKKVLKNKKRKNSIAFSNPFQKDLKFSSGRSNRESYLSQQDEKDKKKRNKFMIILLSSSLAVSIVGGALYYNLKSEQEYVNENFEIIYFGKSEVVKSSSKVRNLEELLGQFDFKKDDKVRVNDKVVEYEKLSEVSVNVDDFIEIIDVRREVVRETRAVVFENIEKEEPTIAKGTSIVAVDGENGEVVVDVIKYYENDKFINQEEIIVEEKDVINQVVLVGSGNVTTYNGPVANGQVPSGGSNNNSQSPNQGSNSSSNGGSNNGGSNNGGSNNGGTVTPPAGCTITINGVVHEC